MSNVQAVLRRAGTRLAVSRCITGAVVLSTAALAGAVVLRVAQQLLGFSVMWWTLAWMMPCAVVVLALAWAVGSRVKPEVVARRVDEGADLRDSLSTALAMRGRGAGDAWASAVVEAAEQRARGVDVRRAIPITAPKWWPSPLVGALVLLIVWVVMPSYDLLGRSAQAKRKDAEKQDLVKVQTQAQQAIAKVQEQLNKVDPEAKKGDLSALAKPDATKPEDIRRAALKNLTTLKDRLEQLKTKAPAQTAQQLQDKLKQLRTPGQGPLTPMSQSLAQSDFKKAAEEMQDAAKKLNEGAMSDKDQEQLKKQLENLARQLNDIAKDKSDLERKLAEAGLDKKLAGDPEALKKAMENNPKLTEQQKQQMQQQAAAAQAAQQMLQQMAQSAQQAASPQNQAQSAQGQQGQQGQQAQQAQQGQSGMSQQQMQAMAQMAQQMGNMEAMAQDLASINAGLQEAKYQMSQAQGGGSPNGESGNGNGGTPDMAGSAPFREGEEEGKGAGRGGPGQSSGGGGVGENQKDYTTQVRKFKTNTTGEGPIIGSTLVQGETIKGESKAQFQQAVQAADAAATEALENNVIERQYQDVVKHYFGRLKAKGGAAPAAGVKPAVDGGK